MKTLAGSLILTGLLLSSAVLGQSGYFPALGEVSYGYYGAGARAFAMGDAFVGLANDITGGTWNPAGIWVIETPMVSASYFIYQPNGRFTQNLTPVVTEGKLNTKVFSHFSFATPFRVSGRGVVFNFNYNRNNEFSNESEIYSGVINKLNPDVFTSDRGYLRTFSFGLSARIYRQLSVGAMANVYDGRRIIEESFSLARDLVIAPGPPPITGLWLSKSTLLDSTSSSGFNFTLGAMYKLSKVSFGAVAQTPYKVKNSSDFALMKVATFEGLPQIQESDTIFVNDSIAKLDIPLSLAFGVAFFPNEKLTATMDINYQRYGSVNWFYRDSTFFSASGIRTDFYTPIPVEWNNTLGLGVGVEYSLPTKVGRVPLRAGFRFDQLPQPKNTVVTYTNILDDEGQPTDSFDISFSTEDRQNSMSLCVGTGVHWSKLGFDMAYRYTSGAETNVTGFVNGTMIEKRKQERKAHEFRFTFTGYL